MNYTDLYKIKVNHFGSHIVVDLMIVIIITTISIILLRFLSINEQNKYGDSKNKNILHTFYKGSIFLILIVIHIVFGLWPVISYSLEKSLSQVELFALPFIYGIYLTFLMKRVSLQFNQKLRFINILYLKKLVGLSIHFSIVPMIIASILTLIYE